MRAAYVQTPDPQDPLAALVLGERPEPPPREGWARVKIRAASLNHHDVFTLRGVGVAAADLPMIIGCDAAGEDESGRPVIVHAVLNAPAWTGPTLLDPGLSVLSEQVQGTFAEYVEVPVANLVPKPDELSFAEAACLPTAWVTAHQMLFGQGQVGEGDTVLVQGASGGLAAALVMLAADAGIRVWLTSRSVDTAAYLLDLGADQIIEHGSRLPDRVDAVFDGVGAATWGHSLKALRPGGTLVAVGGVSGFAAEVDIARVIRNRLRIVGSMMGSREDLEAVVELCRTGAVKPPIDETIGLDDLPRGLGRMVGGGLAGKIVVSL